MFARRCFLLCAALLLVPIAVPAAPIEQRSPFTQGHWWDPSRSGHGFELLNNGGQVAAVWYTYDEAGAPTWYYAQGAVESLGSQAFSLMKMRWAEGRVAAPTVVGSLRLTIKHPESIDAAWDIGGRTGTWTIQPFTVSGVINEVDHTGHWYNPSNNGWGFTLTDQGEVLGAVLYAYDTAGAPTWGAGFGRLGASRKVDMFATTGYCPYCTPRTIANRALGSLTFDYQSETSLTVRNDTSMALAAGLNIGGARVAQLGRPASARPADRQLASFSTPATLLAYLRDGMHNVLPVMPPGGIGVGSDFSAAPGSTGPAYSPTNLQERDVDEAGILKSDGRLIYTFVHEGFSAPRAAAVRIVEAANGGTTLTNRGSIALQHGANAPTANAGLLLHEGTLVALTGTLPNIAAPFAWLPSASWQSGITDVEMIDVRDTAAPVSRWRARLDGNLIASRRIGNRVFLVLRHVPTVTGFVHGYASTGTRWPANVSLLETTPLSTLTPKARLNGGAPVDAVAVPDYHAPPHAERKPAADMTLVYELDIATPRIVRSLAVIGGVETVYASSGNLYLATSRQGLSSPLGPVVTPSSQPVTDIHRVAIGADGLRLAGSAALEGFLSADPSLAQFRLSEHQGRLRVVTSTNDSTWWGGAHRNRLTILEPSTVDPGLLKTVGFIPNANRPETIGLPQERLYATRFTGDRLYAVTYGPLRTGVIVDPLYVVDLSSAQDPRIRGELIIPGFSEYLHPLPGGLLLGVGQDATLTGVPLGMKVALFDVSNDALPREITSVNVGAAGTTSALLTHHHAFSGLIADDGTGTFAFPARVATGVSFGRTLWNWSGLVRFDLARVGGTMQLRRHPDLVTHTAANNPEFSERVDPAVTTARSVLFPGSTIYTANGYFWRQDVAGNVTGPF